MSNAPRETAEQSQAWDAAIGSSADVLDGLAAEVAADLKTVPAEANDTTW